MRKWSIILSCLVLVAALAGCTSQGGDAGDTTAPVRLNIATATTGGAFYPAGIATAQLWTEKGGVEASASTSAGSVENVDLLANREADVVCIQSNVLQFAYEGSDSFAGNAHPELRILVPFLSQHYNILIREGSGIQSMEDWRGKRVVVGRAGSGTVTTHEKVLGAFGITLDDVDAHYLGQAEAIDALRNGMADATIGVGAAPLSAISDALAAPGSNVKLYSLTDAEMKTIIEANLWMSPMNIPAGVYPNQPQEVQALGHVGYLVVRDDFPEDLAYKLVKLMYDEMEWLQEAYSGFEGPAFVDPAPAVLPMPVPLHPGTEKFYKEAGYIQ